jgi:tripartite-type tricarboxylate transporter receptor subunit TctC
MTIERRRFLGGALAAMLPRAALAQAGYPDHVIRLIVPRPSGGVVDVTAREWSEKAGKSLGPSYVDNVGGGGGTIGAAAAARAASDGYTLLLGTTSELVISPILSRQSYDPVSSFEPIAMICESTASIVVHPSVPVATAATKAALQDPALRKRFAAGGFEAVTDPDPASASAYLKAEIARWTPLLEQFAPKR